ncbi:uncharacterized protein LOC135084105 [Ostrinia nubilalis]|uniref:uncharacterized protein LOC135084105 n=1 Tax=Ostrinia nubilalis TaxID=29057 RepID=UPI0030823CC2
MEITTTSTAPFQRVALDIVGPLPESGPAKLKYILTLQDDLTKYSVAYPIRSTTAEETSDCLIHFISLFGIPKQILTDQGTNFTSDLFKTTCQFLKIKQLWSSPYHPQTQGALERSHSTLKEYLKSFVNTNQDNWPTYVYTAMHTYNTTVHSSTKFTPYELVFGHKPLIPNSVYESGPGTTYSDYTKMLQHKFKYTREKARENILNSKETSKTYYDSHSKPPPCYKAVFQKLRNFKLQPDKCEFLRKEVGYLGHIITENGLKPDPKKTKSVQEFPVPKCPKDIKSFLGLISYYRRFIPDFSKLSKPLTNLLKKDVPFDWTNEQQLSFETLKDKLVSAPVLIYPDFTKPFTLTCDASNHAISAILSQGPTGKDHPIAYSSRTLNKNEVNYSTTEKELLAIVFGCKNFRPYLFGRKFFIVTDHRPLKWLFNHSDPSSKMQRWRLQLEEYEYEIIYQKGKLNSAADALSRYPVNPIQPESQQLPIIPEEVQNIPLPTPATNANPVTPNLDPETSNPNEFLPSPDHDLTDLGPIDFSPQSQDLNLNFDDITISSPLNPDESLSLLNPLNLDNPLNLPSPPNPESPLNLQESPLLQNPLNPQSPFNLDDLLNPHRILNLLRFLKIYKIHSSPKIQLTLNQYPIPHLQKNTPNF